MALKKNLANKLFEFLARCEEKICIQTLKIENFGSKEDENAEFDSAKFWNFDFWKIGFRENEKIAPHNFEKMQHRHLKIWNSISILNFGAGKLISKIWKSFSSIPLECHFETPKFEFSDVENPQFYIAASKFWFSL